MRLRFSVAVGLLAGAASTFNRVAFGWASITNDRAITLTQPWGELFVHLDPVSDGENPITIEKGTGQTSIYVQPGVELDLTATTAGRSAIGWARTSEDGTKIIDSDVCAQTAQGGQWVVDEQISATANDLGVSDFLFDGGVEPVEGLVQ